VSLTHDSRLEVIIRSISMADTTSEDFLQYLQRARTELEAADTCFRTKEEIDIELDGLRSGDKYLKHIYNQIEATPRSEQQHEC
jgi:hypothetical protein